MFAFLARDDDEWSTDHYAKIFQQPYSHLLTLLCLPHTSFFHAFSSHNHITLSLHRRLVEDRERALVQYRCALIILVLDVLTNVVLALALGLVFGTLLAKVWLIIDLVLQAIFTRVALALTITTIRVLVFVL